MKRINFLSRFTFICNLAFCAFIIFGQMESGHKEVKATDTVVAFPFLKESVIVLGFSAIIINFLMCITYAILIIAGRKALLKTWLVVINFLFLIVQFYFFFFK